MGIFTRIIMQKDRRIGKKIYRKIDGKTASQIDRKVDGKTVRQIEIYKLHIQKDR